ncbi:hypothetical protein K488DRAFT_85444 [Vararia minispora EC-137]|uniref:Uncharacterized protein n=1 Tax=Vararia minispora EC-137 TaxID=1314806 RepID=A0ACB8QLZ8_9AGAM|nr:hypothetical protein K488DRAFT_85444 [Vararia minispora EC-137]
MEHHVSGTQQTTDQSDYFDALFGAGNSQGHVADAASGRGNGGRLSPTAVGAYAPNPRLQPPPPMSSLPLDTNFDFLGGIGTLGPSPSPQGAAYNPQLVLQQRLKLNQLQQLQLQNQILQHQVRPRRRTRLARAAILMDSQLEMLSSQSQAGSPMDVDSRQKTPNQQQAPQQPPSQQQQQQQHYGLPTPLNSTEIHAQPSADFVSPMALSYMDTTQFRPTDSGPHSHTPLPPPDLPLHPQHASLAGAHSAPANLVFNTAPPVPLPSPSDLGDFDLSPLTSPWIEAYKHSETPQQARSGKRTASPAEDEAARYVRARPSPALQAVGASARQPRRGTKSASSTPLMRSTRRGNSRTGADGIVGDSPSPVDLSMPPPAPPSGFSPPQAQPQQLHELGAVSITPVTPASMMNLGRLGGLGGGSPDAGGRTTRRRGSTAAATSAGKKAGSAPLVSPSLKPILPAGGMSSQPAPGSGIGASSGAMPVPALRKTSHKAAEQKRRDSLKTTFDELRGLLPPIPLPSEDGFGDEPILPGAMPPRGPPRGATDGPNRGISKLQLLRCGNDYIRHLKGQVGRRDEEVGRLRSEVARLRGVVGPERWQTEEGEEIDLDRDLDEGEGGAGPWKRSSTQPLEEDGEEDGAD